MIRVLQVLGSLQRGGAETMVMNCYRRIDRRKVQFDFLVKDKVDDGYEDEAAGYGARILHVRSAREQGIVSYVRQLRLVMHENGPYQIIHSHVNNLSGLVLAAAKMAGIPNRVSHSHSTRYPDGLQTPIGKALIELFATKKLACGEAAGRALYGHASFEIVQNGIDDGRFLGLPYTGNLEQGGICHIGRFLPVKNQGFIVEVCRLLGERGLAPRVTLVGDGDLRCQIEASVSDEIPNLVFPGSVADPERFLAKSRIFILPSLYEGLPLTAIEAQCAGRICLLSDQISREVDLGLGLVRFLPLDVDVWVDALTNLLTANVYPFVDDDVISGALVDRGYSASVTAEKMQSMYEEMAR